MSLDCAQKDCGGPTANRASLFQAGFIKHFFDCPDVIRNLGFHRGSDAECGVNPAEIVIHEVKSNELRQTLKMPVEFVLHSLRHTYGTWLGEAGADAFRTMGLMGHSTVTVSQRYPHPTPEALERAVERLEGLNKRRRILAGGQSATTRYNFRHTLQVWSRKSLMGR